MTHGDQDPFARDEGDPFSLNEPVHHSLKDASLDMGGAGFTDPYASAPAAKRKSISSAAALAIGAVGMLALGGIVVGAWLLASNVDYSEPLRADETVVENPEPLDIASNRRPDLTSFSAVPGDRFVSEAFEQLHIGEDIPSGVYVAEVDNGDYSRCSWEVKSEKRFVVETYILDGRATEHGAVAVLPDGYFVNLGLCDNWVAIDPATLFEGATETVLGDGTHYVGRDLVPGTYVLSRADGQYADSCVVTVSEEWGFTGPAMRHALLRSDEHPAVLDLHEGLTVHSSGCPSLQLVEAEELFSQGLGASEFTEGGWVVGVDVLPGTYAVSDEVVANRAYCMVSAWDQAALQSAVWDQHGIPSHYGKRIFETRHPGDPVIEVTLEAGQTVHSDGCGPITRVGD